MSDNELPAVGEHVHVEFDGEVTNHRDSLPHEPTQVVVETDASIFSLTLHPDGTEFSRPARADGGTVVEETTPDEWTVRDRESGNERTFDSRSEAESSIADLEGLGVDAELLPPGTNTDDEGDGDEPAEPDAADAEVVEAQPAPEAATQAEARDLPDRSLSEDPLSWVPGEFIDEIDGTQAINRKGFEVLAHFYDVDVHADLEVPPEETGFEYARVKAVAVTADGRECEAYGSAHVDRGDDGHLLLEMADTRARKRALSIATGVGAVAVEELKNEVDA